MTSEDTEMLIAAMELAEEERISFKDSNYECDSCHEEKPDVIERGNGYYCDDCWPIY